MAGNTMETTLQLSVSSKPYIRVVDTAVAVTTDVSCLISYLELADMTVGSELHQRTQQQPCRRNRSCG